MSPAIQSRTAPSLLALRGVDKTYANGTLALAKLEFNVRAGEFLSLLGPSGCGKSTALRIIAGLTTPSRGTIEWPDQAVTAGTAGRTGFVFQEPTLMPWASVFKNVALPLVLKSVAANEVKARVARALDRVGLAQF